MMQPMPTAPTSKRGSSPDVLSEVLRLGARKLLIEALEAEVEAYVSTFSDLRDSAGHRMVARDGYAPERSIQTGVGPLEVKRPRVDDRRTDEHGERIRFSSKILPPYLRRTKSIEEVRVLQTQVS